MCISHLTLSFSPDSDKIWTWAFDWVHNESIPSREGAPQVTDKGYICSGHKEPPLGTQLYRKWFGGLGVKHEQSVSGAQRGEGHAEPCVISAQMQTLRVNGAGNAKAKYKALRTQQKHFDTKLLQARPDVFWKETGKPKASISELLERQTWWMLQCLLQNICIMLKGKRQVKCANCVEVYARKRDLTVVWSI